MSKAILRWYPRWRLLHWAVCVEEWEHRLLEGGATAMTPGHYFESSTTGRYFEVSPPLWIWIEFLRLLLGLRSERARVWAARRWRRIQVTYWDPESGEVSVFRAQPVIGGFKPDRRRTP